MALKSFGLTTEITSSIDLSYNRQGQRKYLLYADPTDDENAVRNEFIASSSIAIGTGHPTDAQQRCLSVAITCNGRVSNPGDNTPAIQWECIVGYGPWNPLENSFTGNPVNIPAMPRFEVENASVPALVDVDGNPIVNSAGDYYGDPVERDVPKIVLKVRRNEASPNIPYLLSLANVTNVAVWNGFPVETVRFLVPAIPEVLYNQATSSFYWPFEYEFWINFDTWIKQVLNRGFRQLDSTGKLVPILVNGQPLSDPVFLDQSGKAILTPDYLQTGGDTPEGSGGGESGEVAGGGEPPEAGASTEGGSIQPNAYRVYRTFDFTYFNMGNLFTLPSPLS